MTVFHAARAAAPLLAGTGAGPFLPTTTVSAPDPTAPAAENAGARHLLATIDVIDGRPCSRDRDADLGRRVHARPGGDGDESGVLETRGRVPSRALHLEAIQRGPRAGAARAREACARLFRSAPPQG